MMKFILTILTVLLLTLSCADEKKTYVQSNRFWDSLIDATEIGELEQITDDGRFLLPYFAPGDSILIANRLLATDAETASRLTKDQISGIMGININTKDIFKLSKYPNYPTNNLYQDSLSSVPLYEYFTYAIQSNDSSVIAFETIIDVNTNQRAVYISKEDSVYQLSYGDLSCSLDRFSNTGRYLTALIGNNKTWVIIFDLQSGKAYKIPNDEERPDSMIAFSSDDKMIAFVRSEGLVSNENNYYGDIWIFKFKE